MYSFSQYFNRGISFVRNGMFHSKLRLSTLMLYATDICNSKCQHCNIWQKLPKQHLSMQNIRQIFQSQAVTSKTRIGLEGGEFLLHPQAFEILKHFDKYHPNYDLLTNCLAPQRLDEVLDLFAPKHLYVSLDGDKNTYMKMRGVDGFETVIAVMAKYKNRLPVSAMFTLSPYSNFNDLEYVADICKSLQVDLRIGIYSNMEYFGTDNSIESPNLFNYQIKDIPSGVHDFNENFDFLALYPGFIQNEVKLPCYSIYDSLVIYPNGDVPLCQFKEIILGNINNRPLDAILNSIDAKKTRNQHCKECNQCWINFHRKYDIVLLRNLEKILPKKIIETIVGNYQWSANPKLTYRSFVQSQTG